MVRATWNGAVIAESDDTIVVEGNHYFPIESVDQRLLQPSSKVTTCPWKGQASYYTIVVDGAENRDAAWYYPTASSKARRIEGRVAFWKGVKVADDASRRSLRSRLFG
jgi:uncharacterized protein (DUF427 family)